MSKADQINLNFILSEKLADYLITKPDMLRKFSGCSYVVFSVSNNEFNALNHELIIELKNEDKTVVKALETGNQKEPWIFTPLYN